MEDILGWTIITAIVASVVYAAYCIFTRKSKHEATNLQYETEKTIRAERLDQIRSARPVPPPAPPARTTNTVAPTTAEPAKDWSPDMLTTMIIADMLTHNKSSSAGSVTWDNDTPTIHPTKSDSFGFDDSDSRKSASSSFSSSDSSSSWSSSSDSSSSSSGPSSDW